MMMPFEAKYLHPPPPLSMTATSMASRWAECFLQWPTIICTVVYIYASFQNGCPLFLSLYFLLLINLAPPFVPNPGGFLIVELNLRSYSVHRNTEEARAGEREKSQFMIWRVLVFLFFSYEDHFLSKLVELSILISSAKRKRAARDFFLRRKEIESTMQLQTV